MTGTIHSTWASAQAALRTLFVILFVALVSAPGLAAAAPPERQSERYATVSAQAYNSTCVPQGNRELCTSESIFVNRAKQGDEVCVSTDEYVRFPDGRIEWLSSEYGCSPLPRGCFTIDAQRLSSATLCPTNVDLITYTCDPATGECTEISRRTVSVSATFTGTGELTTYKSHSKYSFGGCTYSFSGQSTGRDARATYTLDGEVSQTGGFLVRSKSAYKQTCS